MRGANFYGVKVSDVQWMSSSCKVTGENDVSKMMKNNYKTIKLYQNCQIAHLSRLEQLVY